ASWRYWCQAHASSASPSWRSPTAGPGRRTRLPASVAARACPLITYGSPRASTTSTPARACAGARRPAPTSRAFRRGRHHIRPSRLAGHLQWFCMKLGRIFGEAVGLREAASIVFALTALLPLLLAVLALHRTGALWTFEAETAVLLAVATAVIGFMVFRVMVDRVARLA